jgi:hypothetical protein
MIKLESVEMSEPPQQKPSWSPDLARKFDLLQSQYSDLQKQLAESEA